MTPVLYPGDRIHIQVPVKATSKALALIEIKQALEELESFYKPQGITIVGITGHSTLTHTQIVSIIRAAPNIEVPVTPRNHWNPWQEPPEEKPRVRWGTDDLMPR